MHQVHSIVKFKESSICKAVRTVPSIDSARSLLLGVPCISHLPYSPLCTFSGGNQPPKG